MVLRVQPVPAPAAGRDWSYTVPGQYQMDVKAVQATLLTPANITTALDSSGNGLNLAVTDASSRLTWAAPGPYGGGASNFALAATESLTLAAASLKTGNSALLGTNPQSIVALVNLGTFVDTGWSTIAMRQLAGTIQLALALLNNGHDPADLQGVFSGSFFTLANGLLPRNAWHQVGATVDGVDWRIYLDGVLKATVAGHQPAAATTPFFWCDSGFENVQNRIAAVAVFPATLTAGQMLAYVAAQGSNAAYKAALLADAPAALWMLDDTGNMGSRKAVLEVTNGTTTVADFPGGSISGVNGSFTWTWGSQTPGITQSADATVNLIQIPDLILPGGYTIGTVTPDLGLADSWTNINIWWDDGTIGPHDLTEWGYEGAILLPEGFPFGG
jgi:hypothetical protein